LKAKPVLQMLGALLENAVGIQSRRTINCGVFTPQPILGDSFKIFQLQTLRRLMVIQSSNVQMFGDHTLSFLLPFFTYVIILATSALVV
jgi:hypothetical protein